jgi:hypothetical protein
MEPHSHDTEHSHPLIFIFIVIIFFRTCDLKERVLELETRIETLESNTELIIGE